VGHLQAVGGRDELASLFAHQMVVFKFESALSVVQDGSHRRLAHTLRASLLSRTDLLLHPFGVVMLHFL